MRLPAGFVTSVLESLNFSKAIGFFKKTVTGGKGLLFCFLAGFFVRLIPEFLAFPHPIGFDTVYYAAALREGVIWPHWSSFFTHTWLFYAITVPLYQFIGGEPFLFLKVAAPLLYGLNVAGIYWFARKMLGWSTRSSFLAGGFFAFQLASLRISWDLLRNTLGMGLLLFALPFVDRLNSKREVACFVLLSLLTVFAHEYSAVSLLVIVLVYVFTRLNEEKGDKVALRTVLGLLPALTIFSAGLFLRIFPISYAAETNVLSTGELEVGRFFFFANYFSVEDTVFHYPSYWSLVFDVVVLFALLYLPYLFLVWKGFFRNVVLDVWTGLLLIGSFGCLIFPFFALDFWSRWMFMLVYPFTFYAVNGLTVFLRKYEGSDVKSLMKFTSRKVKGMILLTVLLGCVYLATPVLMSTVNIGVFAISPASAHFSSAPTVPYEDVNGVVEAMEWLDGNMDGDSCVVLQHAFLSWGQLYLDKSHTIVHFENDVNLAVDTAFEHGFTRVFFVWWNEPIGWYGVTVPEGFVRLQDFGRISVYEYI